MFQKDWIHPQHFTMKNSVLLKKKTCFLIMEEIYLHALEMSHLMSIMKKKKTHTKNK